jgi:site-specific DNA-methyltransferase (adenine-specific)
MLYQGDCRDAIKSIPDSSVDAIVTDPPYELGFMGKSWDASGIAYSIDLWRDCLRVLKPGGHLLSFGGTRTWHRMTCAIEDAGFEIRDTISWIYGSGFPKGTNISKAIDKAAGHSRGSADSPNHGNAVFGSGMGGGQTTLVDPPVTDEAMLWEGWNTALKPACEPIVVARKSLIGTVAANMVRHGTGALNVDGCRVPSSTHDAGRWPANVLLDEVMAGELDAQSGPLPGGSFPARRGADRERTSFGGFNGQEGLIARRTNSGGASRFFPIFKYQAKAPSRERPKVDSVAHPTVKPLELMRWLVRLVTPPGGLVLDPFAGSGTTAEAAIFEGMRCLTVEQDDSHIPLIIERLRKHGDPA